MKLGHVLRFLWVIEFQVSSVKLMDLIKITDKFVTLNNELYDNVTLLQGKTYLLRKAHVQGIVNLGLGQRVDGFDRLPHLPVEALRVHSEPVNVLFLFDGGLGDAISLGILLNALKVKYNIRSDVACKDEVWTDILRPLGFSGKRIQLPAELEIINEYDYIQTRGDSLIQDKTEMYNKCIVEELGRSYGIDLSRHSVQYSIPPEIRKKSALPGAQKIRIGLNFDSKGLIRSYPKELQPVLVNYLLTAGFEIYILGQDKTNLSGVDINSSVHDYCGKTTVLELAAMAKQMDLMVCLDSFIAHLSNVLGINTIVLLSTTRKGIFSWHKNITCLESRIECSPCGEIANDCPRGYEQCQAFFHASARPEVVTYFVLSKCTNYFKHIVGRQTRRVFEAVK